MRTKIILIIFLLSIVTVNSIIAESDVPTVTIPPRGYAHLGEDYTISVTLKNETGEKIWKCWAEIITDKLSEYIEVVKDRAETIKFENGAEVTLDLVIRFRDNAPSGEYVIPISVSGKWTACTAGCKPMRPQIRETKVILIIEKPMIAIELKDDYTVKGEEDLEIPFKIKNLGTGTAYNLSVSYVSDYKLLENLESPDISGDLNASGVIDEKLYLNTENIDYGDYSLTVNVEYFDMRNKKLNFQKKCNIHILGPTEEEIYQEKLNKAVKMEREAESLLGEDEFESALEKYKEAKALYEEIGANLKVNDINGKINLIENTIDKIKTDTEKADQMYQRGVGEMNSGNYNDALKDMEDAKSLYTLLFNLTKYNEDYKTLYEKKIADCEEKIDEINKKIDETKIKIEMPELKTVFVIAIILSVVALICGIVLIRKE